MKLLLLTHQEHFVDELDFDFASESVLEENATDPSVHAINHEVLVN